MMTQAHPPTRLRASTLTLVTSLLAVVAGRAGLLAADPQAGSQASGPGWWMVAALILCGVGSGVVLVRYIKIRRELQRKDARLREAEEHASALRLQSIAGNLSVRDSVTGLFNREYLEASLDREIRRAARERAPVAMIMLALPDVNAVRVKFGQEAANLVLREVANLLPKNIRGSDVACRYEDNEFALLLPAMSREQAIARADALRSSVEALNLNYQSQPLDPITACVGVAVHSEHSRDGSSQAVLRAACAALYEARTWERSAAVATR